MASTSTRPRRGIRAVPLAALVTSVALVATGSTLTACTPTKEPSMNQDEAAAVVRAEVRAMAAQLGHGVSDYAEKLVPCETMPAGSTMSFNVSLRLVPDDDRVAQMRAGYLAGKEVQGWRLRDDNTADHAGWTIQDGRGFNIGYFVFPGKAQGTVGGSGPCLPKDAGAPATQTWSGTST